MTKKYTVIFEPSGIRGHVKEGKTILEASRELGVEIESVRGGETSCGKCKVKLEKGLFEKDRITSLSENLSPFTEEEKKFISETDRAAEYRLGCAARIRGDVLILVPEESRAGKQVVRKVATERKIDLKPTISLHSIELSPPTLRNTLGDFDRLKKALAEKYNIPSLQIDYPALIKLPTALRLENWKATVALWMGKEIIDIKPGKVDDAYGLAIDIGTTTVAGYLCSLRSGRVIVAESMMNPQVPFGEDVMSRITYAITHEGGLERLHRSIIDGLNQLIQILARVNHLSLEDILELSVVGNTVMHHFFLKISPEYLGVAPFPPAIHRSLDVKARDLGLHIHPCANFHLLPIPPSRRHCHGRDSEPVVFHHT